MLSGRGLSLNMQEACFFYSLFFLFFGHHGSTSTAVSRDTEQYINSHIFFVSCGICGSVGILRYLRRVESVKISLSEQVYRRIPVYFALRFFLFFDHCCSNLTAILTQNRHVN